MKQYHRYQMDFNGKAVTLSAVCMGLSMFLSVLYYLAFSNLEDISGGELVIRLWLPLALGIIYLALLKVIRWNAPGIYGILGAVFCLVHILIAFTSGNGGRVLIVIPSYVVCAAALLIIVGGYFPAKLPAALLFAIAIVLEIVLFNVIKLDLMDLIKEAAPLLMMASFIFLPMGLKSTRTNKKEQL